MAETVFPTKGNLIATKRSLALARQGYDLLDRKRNILIREMMGLIETAASVQERIDETFSHAYFTLQRANITLGIVDHIAPTVPVENGVHVVFRSVMGVEIPTVRLENNPPRIHYGFAESNTLLDEAYVSFNTVKQFIAVLAEIENSVYRLANAIKKTQRRANALKNIIIPQFDHTVKFIADALEEKEREDFSRLKIMSCAKQRRWDEADEQSGGS